MFGQNLSDIQKRRFFNALVSVCVLLAVFLGVKIISTLKEYSYIGRSSYAANAISVSGSGEVFVLPDTATFSFSVNEESKTVSEAQKKVTDKMNAILDALKKLGIEDRDIKTSNYSSYPQYDYTQSSICTSGYCPPSKPVLRGYEVSHSITVKVRKTDNAGSALAKVGDLGASNISGLSFVVDDMDKAQAEARDKAVKDAQAKAEVLAKSLGIRLKKIVNFYETGSGDRIFYATAMEGKAMGMGGDMMSASIPQTPTGENKIVSNVTITYEIN